MDAVIKELENRKLPLFAGITQETLAAYQFIQEAYGKGKTSDPLFRFVYCEFYQISDRFTTKAWRDQYFTLFTETDLKTLLEKLTTPGDKVQFSYATKLLHTVDPRLPIYDAMVAKALRLPQYAGKQRLDFYLKTYARLREIHETL